MQDVSIQKKRKCLHVGMVYKSCIVLQYILSGNHNKGHNHRPGPIIYCTKNSV